MQAQAESLPIYRADAKGNIAEVKRDCIALMRGEIASAECFMMEAADCEMAMREYGKYLTRAELAACFKKAAQS